MSSTFACTLLAALASGYLVAQQVRVIDADSGWKLQSNTLAAGGSVSMAHPISGAASSRNLVLDCAESGWLAYSCKDRPCVITACSTEKFDDSELRRIGPPLSLVASFRGTANDLLNMLLTRKARQPVLLAARAGGSPNDAVLLQDGRGIHWGPALRRVLEGKYCFQLSRLTDPTDVKTFTMEWDRSLDPEGVAVAPGIVPGGYRLQKGSSDSCDPDAEASPAWIVIAPSTFFAGLNSDWQGSNKWLEQLAADGASASTVTTARQAVLTALAEVVERQ